MVTPDPKTGTYKAPLEKLRQELDSLLEAAWSNGERALDAFGFKSTKPQCPDVDVVESDESVTVYADLPGIDPQTVDVTLVGNMLTLKAERIFPMHRDGEVHLLHERARGLFYRSVPLTVPVNPDLVSAETHHGTLVVRLTKQNVAKPKHIRVEVKCDVPPPPM